MHIILKIWNIDYLDVSENSKSIYCKLKNLYIFEPKGLRELYLNILWWNNNFFELTIQ